MFFGREKDLSQLSKLWNKTTSSLVTCRGRRRIGKSTLIEEFARISKARFLKIEGKAPNPKSSNQEQLIAFAEQLSGFVSSDIVIPKNWLEAFRKLDEFLDDRKTVLLLDEVSWMGKYDRGFPGDLKMAWDNLFKKHDHLIVFVCGSVSTWISKNILNNTGFVGRASLNLTLRELPIDQCVKFWGLKANRIAPREILDVLSVTGGVPRYLEEIDPSLSAAENIRQLCFTPGAILRDDFSKVFNTIFSENATTKKAILDIITQGPKTVSEIAEALKVDRNGGICDHLDDLVTAGFLAKDIGINLQTGNPTKTSRYRLSDNYTRFFLKYIKPNERAIDEEAFTFNSLDALPAWTTILGLQFENLVLNNLPRLLPLIGLERTLLKSAAPFRQNATARKKGCQIDLLLVADRMVYVIEIKRRREIGLEIEEEVSSKVKALALPRDITVRTALVYDGHLSEEIAARGYFDALISSETLLGLSGINH